jgi:hypothetical protein
MAGRVSDEAVAPLAKALRRANVGDANWWATVPQAEQDEFDAALTTDAAERDLWASRARLVLSCIEKEGCELANVSGAPDRTTADEIADALAQRSALDATNASQWWATKPRQAPFTPGASWSTYDAVGQAMWRYRIASALACLGVEKFEVRRA